MSTEREPKKSLFERAADVFDLPADVLAGLPRLEIAGCRRLLMENHRGILEYSGEQIDINGGQVVVRVKGKGLDLRAMNANELSLDGLLFSIEFVF
ncbi:MAG: YabP/YqfC family sporulation protein [Oscillospiraceae bacterium]|nr:YabP/YqfC family sporulation protein [Oscillospiraceae bacterium]